jgi:hypothetical protein
MTRGITASLVVATILTGFHLDAIAQDHAHQHASGDVGTVNFSTTCAPAARERMNQGVALLHSFWFPAAIASFDAALEQDPACAMAWWGKALSYWGNPFAPDRSPAALAAGLEASRRARDLPASPRERAWIDAVATLYDEYQTRTNRERVLAYEDAMAKLHADHPRDDEAAIFYALSLTQTALPTDKSYANLLKAGMILEVQQEHTPQHPGIAHYIIHSYDVPALADRALAAARRYSGVAPAVPHALHMPSHTFTRVGLWEESIESNLASARAARENNSAAEELHALDYQAYAYLQTGQDEAVARILAELPAIVARIDLQGTASAAPPIAGIYAAAAIPARYTLERGAWAEAARLPARRTATPYADALTYFARALGAARSGQPDAASADLDSLGAMRAALAPALTDMAAEVEIAERSARAWQRYARGDRHAAITELRAVADMQDATEKSGISPGPLAPSRELLAEMLLDAGRGGDALLEFEAVLANERRRFRSIAGAAAAAELTGDTGTALGYHAALAEMAERGDRPGRAPLAAARRAVQSRR